MPDQDYNGIILEDKWGKTYLCSNCLFAYADLGQSTLTEIKDPIYGRYFLHDLEPATEQRNIWAKMYQQARPTQFDLSRYTNLQLRDSLIDIFHNNEMWIWPLSDGWGQQPEGNGISDGGLAPVASSGSSAPTVAKAAKPKGGGVATENEAPAKVAKHNAKTTAAAQTNSHTNNTKKVEPESLEHAQKILAERRKQIEQSGYKHKYSDSELLEIAHDPELINERFHVRLIFNSADKAMDSTLGYRRVSGRAPYWATTFDMAESADTDPELLACIFGIKSYSSVQEFSLVIIDTHNLPHQAERQSFVPTFVNMTAFCNDELAPEELGNFQDVSAVMNDKCTEEYTAFMLDYKASGQSEHDTDAVRKHLKITRADKATTEKIVLRHKIQSECGANSLFSGNGLTKVNHKNRFAADVPQEFGVVETFTFERDPLTLKELGSSIAVIPAKPIKG